MTRPAHYPPALLSAPEAARYIGISERTLAGLGIPRKMLGGRRLYRITDLDAYVDSLPYEAAGEDQACAEADRAFGGPA